MLCLLKVPQPAKREAEKEKAAEAAARRKTEAKQASAHHVRRRVDVAPQGVLLRHRQRRQVAHRAQIRGQRVRRRIFPSARIRFRPVDLGAHSRGPDSRPPAVMCNTPDSGVCKNIHQLSGFFHPIRLRRRFFGKISAPPLEKNTIRWYLSKQTAMVVVMTNGAGE